MANKPFSERKDFRNALILSAAYSANPSVSGWTEVAFRWTKTGVSVWFWEDELGSELVETLPAKSDWRSIARWALSSDLMNASVFINDITIRGDTPPLGGILSMAWNDDESLHTAASVLLCLSDQAVTAIVASETHLNREFIAMLEEIYRTVDEESLSLDDLRQPITPKSFDMDGIQKAITDDIRSAAGRKAEAERLRLARLAPFAADIERILSQWKFGKAPSRWLGSVSNFSPGLGRLRSYLETYVLANAVLPTGLHTIPAAFHSGSNWERHSLTVDFDHLVSKSQ